MIRYSPRSQVGFFVFIHNVIRKALRMPCFGFAFKTAFFVSLLATIVKYLDREVWVDFLAEILPERDVYTGLATMVSLVIVFHTVQSYQRFMNGIALIYQIRGNFHDVASLLICFSKASDAPERDKTQFQNMLVRLFSMHFMVCLADLEDKSQQAPRTAHQYDLIDPEGIDPETLKHIVEAEDKPSAVYQSILDLMMDSYNNRIITVAAPLYTRCFQELGGGMIKFHEAMQFMEVPFPLPYMAITDMLLVVFSILTPFFVSSWTNKIAVAAVFGFTPIFAMWLLHGAAEELDNPFDGDSTDLDADQLIEDFNQSLCSLLGHSSLKPPVASLHAKHSLPSRWKEFKQHLDSSVKSLHGCIESEKNKIQHLFKSGDAKDKPFCSGPVDHDLEAQVEAPKPTADSVRLKMKKSVSLLLQTCGLTAPDGGSVRQTGSQHKVEASHFSPKSAARITQMLDRLEERQDHAGIDENREDAASADRVKDESSQLDAFADYVPSERTDAISAKHRELRADARRWLPEPERELHHSNSTTGMGVPPASSVPQLLHMSI